MRSEAQASSSAQIPPSNAKNTSANASGKAPPQRPLVQPQQPPAAPAKAPAAPPPAPAKVEIEDEDDSFGYNSDDDALIAMADLGPAIDADMGRPIDHEEGLLQPPDDEDPTPPVRARESSAGKTRHELIAAALAGDATIDASATTDVPTAEFIPTSMRATPSVVRAAEYNVMLAMRPPPPPQPRASTSLAQQNHQRYMSSRQQDQNRPPAPQAGKAPSVPSPSGMGGFNFPAGVVCILLGNSHHALANNLFCTQIPMQGGVGGVSLSGVGMKRPADAMKLVFTTSDLHS